MWMSVKASNPTIVTLMPHVTTLKDSTHVVVLMDTRETGKTAQVNIIGMIAVRWITDHLSSLRAKL